MPAYYNEIEPYAAAWLRNLIAAGLIAPGDVDERSIVDVRPDDLAGFTQCHFFAGLGGWSYALRLAGWPDGRPVWTGSCPCQPFSAAGKGGGFADERHLWPSWLHLIRECGPSEIFGEQVASKDGLGWLDLVQADLEGSGYACGAVDFCAAGVGAPHIRQRQWWVAQDLEHAARDGRVEWGPGSDWERATGGRGDVQLADPGSAGLEGRYARSLGSECSAAQRSGEGEPRRMENDQSERLEGRSRPERGIDQGGGRFLPTGPSSSNDGARRAGPVNGLWRSADWLFCRDGRWRPVEPGAFPLAHGVSGRVGRLRAYGNAIVPQVAAEFIRAYLDCRP